MADLNYVKDGKEPAKDRPDSSLRFVLTGSADLDHEKKHWSTGPIDPGGNGEIMLVCDLGYSKKTIADVQLVELTMALPSAKSNVPMFNHGGLSGKRSPAASRSSVYGPMWTELPVMFAAVKKRTVYTTSGNHSCSADDPIAALSARHTVLRDGTTGEVGQTALGDIAKCEAA